jgi:hypothetical protein
MVWWMVHLLEQTLAGALGRPAFSGFCNSNVRMPDPEFEQANDLPPLYVSCYIGVNALIRPIWIAISAASTHYRDAARLVELYPGFLAVQAEVDQWRRTVPAQLRIDYPMRMANHKRAVILLHTWADYLEATLWRPYLLCRVSHDVDRAPRPRVIDEAAERCVSVSHASVPKILALADANMLEGLVWIDFYTAQQAIMIAGLDLVGRPEPPNAQALRRDIGRLIDVVQATRLAPTYRILMNVALQLACITGIGPDIAVTLPDPVKVESEAGKGGTPVVKAAALQPAYRPPMLSVPKRGQAPAPGPSTMHAPPPPTSRAAAPHMSAGGMTYSPHSSPARHLGLNPTTSPRPPPPPRSLPHTRAHGSSPLTTTHMPLSSPASGSQAVSAHPILPFGVSASPLHTAPGPISANVPMHAPAHGAPNPPPHPTIPYLLPTAEPPLQAETQAQLQQLFGPTPNSAIDPSLDMFADLYNLGYNETQDSNPWDFFDVGAVAAGALEVQARAQGRVFGQGQGQGQGLGMGIGVAMAPMMPPTRQTQALGTGVGPVGGISGGMMGRPGG